MAEQICESCSQIHRPDVMCPPHEVRTTGVACTIMQNKWLKNKIKQLEAKQENCTITAWDDSYAGYIIRDRTGIHFVGPNDEYWRVACRCDAARFTKQEALSYVEVHGKDQFVIEDAT